MTGQPDFGKLIIRYQPKAWLAETKSVKLWLWSWRTRKAFNEQIVSEVAEKFFQQIQPSWVHVTGEFNTRGGISVTAEASRGLEEVK